VTKRSPLRLDAIREEEAASPSLPSPRPASKAIPMFGTRPEPTTTIYARVPWTLGEELRDLARRRSREEGRRVTVNDLVVDAIRRLLE
jgi:hypothetical protein